MQNTRTLADIARIRSEVRLKPEVFSGALGPRFSRAHAPRTFLFLEKMEQDLTSINDKTKAVWNRPRPSQASSHVEPCIKLPPNSAYPSGHAIIAYAWASVLAEIYPDHAKDIFARAAQIGRDRIIAGVHYPTDVASGRKFGIALVQQMHDNPRFRDDLHAAAAEAPAVIVESIAPSAAGQTFILRANPEK